jgi:hypothetical protein
MECETLGVAPLRPEQLIVLIGVLVERATAIQSTDLLNIKQSPTTAATRH